MNTALVIVDMLRDFVDGRLANPAAVPTIERIGALAEAARGRSDWIVVYGNDAHQPGDVELRLFGEHAMAGTPGAEVIEQLAPAGGDMVVPKRYYSAFTQTDLEATLLVHDVGRGGDRRPAHRLLNAAHLLRRLPARPGGGGAGRCDRRVPAALRGGRRGQAAAGARLPADFYGVRVVPTAELLG
jgi:hypothetical protein